MRWRSLVSVIAMSAIANFAGACQVGSQANQDSEWIDAEEAAAEYRDEASRLRLAPDWQWPSQIVYDEKKHGMDALYGVNTGRIDASWYWHCSWGRQYLGEPDGEKRGEYLVQVLAVRESAYFKIGIAAEDRPMMEGILNRLAEGDDSDFRELIEVNCPVVDKG